MRRVTKRVLVFFLGTLFTYLCCEFLIYYVVIAQCGWPDISANGREPLRVLILSDPHLLGPRKGHWFDKMRRETQMHNAFQAIITLHKPEAVFILGDLFDEGEWSTKEQFDEYVKRFYRLFAVPADVTMHIAVGNHDIGFHNFIRYGSLERFSKALNTSSVQFLTLKDNHFVIINSMAMEGDKCNMCTEARRQIDNISETLECWRDSDYCHNSTFAKLKYSPPILMQHFPLYRRSDAICTEPDAAPLNERGKKFRLKVDALSSEATEYLVSRLEPRAMFGGHTHHGCLVYHEKENYSFYEYSVPSFSWRNRPDPKYMLVSIRPDDYAVHKCGLPLETTIALVAVILLSIVAWQTVTLKNIGR